MKSFRYNRKLKEAEHNDVLMGGGHVNVDEFHKDRSFGAKAFKRKRAARLVARNSKRVNRLSI